MIVFPDDIEPVIGHHNYVIGRQILCPRVCENRADFCFFCIWYRLTLQNRISESAMSWQIEELFSKVLS